MINPRTFQTIRDQERSPVWPPVQTRLLRTLSCGVWKPSKEGDGTSSTGTGPTDPPLSGWKSFPLSSASLALLSWLLNRIQDLLPRLASSPTSITIGALPAQDRASQCCCPKCMGVMPAPSSC